MARLTTEAVVLGLGALAPFAAQAAYYYEAQTTAEGKGLSGVTLVQGWVDGQRAKIEFQSRDATGLFEAGTYLLSNDAGRTVYWVNPTEKTVAQLDAEQMLKTFGALTNATAGVVNIEFSDFTSENLGEAPGEPILGLPTTRHHHRTGYTMRIAVLGIGQREHTDVENEFWCTDAIRDEGFEVWLRPDRFRTGNEGFDRMIAQEYEVVDCLPLRHRMVTKVTGQRGREMTTTTLTEVLAVRETTAPTGTFELPTGFETVPFLTSVPVAVEGAAAEQSSDAGAASEAPRRPRLRDLIGR
jgi:hypothetical protein